MLAFIPITWMAAWFELGRKPTYRNPAPEQLTGLFSKGCLVVFETLALLTPLSVGLCVTLLLVQMVRCFPRHERVRPFVITLLTCIVLFVAGLTLFLPLVFGTQPGDWMLD